VCRSDGEAALQALEKETPAAVVLDLLMPQMDGFEFLRRLRASGLAPSVPIIVWTAKDLTPSDRTVLASSADAVVVKSDGAAALVEQITTHLAGTTPARNGGA
jgi:DNA-binding response OmpR family regulator